MKRFLYIIIFLNFLTVFGQNQSELNFQNLSKPAYLYLVNNSGNSLFSGNSFTIEMWINIPSNAVNVSDFFDINSLDASNNVTSTLSLGKNGDEVHFGFTAQNVNQSYNSGNVLIDEWNHIALVNNNFNFQIIVNGSLVHSIDLSGNKKDLSKSIFVINAANTASTLDTSSTKFNNVSNCNYDEIRIWNTALTLDNIKSNMFSQVTISSDLSAYYTFDNDNVSSKIIKDITSNGFMLTISGTPIITQTSSPVYIGADANHVLTSFTPNITSDIITINGDASKGGSANITVANNQGIGGTAGVGKIYAKTWTIHNRLLDSANLTFAINNLNQLGYDTSKIVLLEAQDQLFTNPVIHTFKKNAQGNYQSSTIFSDNDQDMFYTIGESNNINPKVTSTGGFGPFIQGKQAITTFYVSNFMPGTSKVVFNIVDRLGNVLDSINAAFNSSKTNASISYDMGVFPLNCLFLIKIYYPNGPSNGMTIMQDIKITPITPNLIITRQVDGFNPSDTTLQNQLKSFNSYKLGDTTTTLTLTVDSLPSQTTKVILSFTDANGNNICYFDTLNVIHCDTFTKKPDIGKLYVDKVVWTVNLDTLALQLSSQVGIRVYMKNGYQNGTLFTYPLKILPPDIQLLSTNGWSATSNAYEFNTNISTPWDSLLDAFNLQFTPSDLPPQTRRVIYSVTDVDSTIIWTDTVKSSNNRPLESATSTNLNMRNLDLKAKKINMKIFALGSPINGINYTHDIFALPQNPRISPSNLGQFIVRDQLDTNDKRTHILNVKIEPSMKNTDSIKLSWIDHHYFSYFDTIMIPKYDNFCECNLVDFNFDVLSLPYKVKGLRILSFYKGAPQNGLDTSVSITLLPPPPKVEQVYWDKGITMDNSIDFYPRWKIYNLPEMTLRSIVNISNSNNQIVLTDTIYPNKAPFDYYAEFNGSNSLIKSQLIKNLNEFTAMTWFNTASSRGGVILSVADTSMTPNINIFMTDSGFVAYSMHDKSFKLREIGNTGARFNHNKWHHLAVVLRKKDNKFIQVNTLEIYIDGGYVGSLLDTVQSLINVFNPYITIGHGVLPTNDITYKFYPVSSYYSGKLSDFRFIDKALSYSDIMKIIKTADTVNTNQIGAGALWWKLNDVGQTTIKDHNGKNNGSLSGNLGWSKSLYQSSFMYLFNTKNLSQGRYFLNVIPQYFGGPDIPYSYRIDSINVGKSLTISSNIDTNGLQFRLINGIGYFQQGMKTNVNVQMEFKSKAPITNTYQLQMIIRKPNGDFFEQSNASINRMQSDSTKLWVGGVIDVGNADPGSKLNIIVFNQSLNQAEFNVTIPFYSDSLPPPLVSYNQGPFLQSIAPETLVHLDSIVVDNILNEVTKITLKFYDENGYYLDSIAFASTNIVGEWRAKYDMANLRPPFSKFQVSQWLKDHTTPSNQTVLYPIELIRTRPLWMNNPSLTTFENISETQDSVFFDLKLLSVTKNYDFMYKFDVPSFIPIVGGSSILKSAGLIQLPIGYSKSTRRLRITKDINEQAAVANFQVGALKTIKDKFSKVGNDPNYKFTNEFNEALAGLSSSNKEALKGSWGFNPVFESGSFYKIDIDTNNLINIQAKSRYMLGVQFDIPAIDAAIKSLNATISDGLAPWSALIRPVIGFNMELDFFTAERKNITSDSLGNMKAVGNLELKAGSDGKDDNNTASYIAYGGLFGLDFSLSAEVGLGAIGKVTITMMNDFPLTFVNMHNDNAKKSLYDMDYSLFWKVDAYIFFGLIHITVKPKSMLYHHRLFGDVGDFQLIYAKNKKDKSNNDVVLESKDIKSKDHYHHHDRDVYPQPDFETKNGKTGMLWLEQDPESAYSTIVFSENSKENSQFGLKKYVYSANSNIHSPKFDYLTDDKIIISFVQNRFNKTNIPSNLQGFQLMNELLKGQDIWYAIYNLSNDSLEFITSIPDNNDNFTSGRTEGSPLVRALNEREAMLVWTVADLDNNESDLHYSRISLKNDVWTNSQVSSICGILEGADINQTLSINNKGDLILSWINVSKDQSYRRIMGSVYRDGNWAQCNTLAEEVNGSKIRYLDQDFDGDYGVLTWTEGRIQDNESGNYQTPMESVKLIRWNNNLSDWDISTMETILDTNILEARDPNIEVNNNGKIAIMYQNNEMAGPVRKANAILGHFDEMHKWTHLINNQLISDTNRRVFDYDFAYHADTLVILSQEKMINTTTSHNPNYKNGVGIGAENANLVLRGFVHRDNLTSINEESIANNLIESDDDILIYPNPASEFIKVVLENNSPIIHFDILDSKGKIVRNVSYELNNGSFNIDISKLSQGIYYVTYVNNGIRKTKSFIVIK